MERGCAEKTYIAVRVYVLHYRMRSGRAADFCLLKYIPHCPQCSGLIGYRWSVGRGPHRRTDSRDSREHAIHTLSFFLFVSSLDSQIDAYRKSFGCLRRPPRRSSREGEVCPGKERRKPSKFQMRSGGGGVA